MSDAQPVDEGHGCLAEVAAHGAAEVTVAAPAELLQAGEAGREVFRLAHPRAGPAEPGGTPVAARGVDGYVLSEAADRFEQETLEVRARQRSVDQPFGPAIEPGELERVDPMDARRFAGVCPGPEP